MSTSPARRILAQLPSLIARAIRASERSVLWVAEGLRHPATRPTGVRLLLAGLLLGGVLGWMNGTVTHVLRETELPKPVTPAPPGTSWARVKTTGYCPCWRCCGWNATGMTAIGRDVRNDPFGIAVDQRLVPYRTTLMVPGYGVAETDDTGAAMRHDADRGLLHLDLRFRTHPEALAWGVRWMWVAVPDDHGAQPHR